ncbi:DUF5067 domain-containing protein [Bifidobacterium leontopitheci]|uniref:DUF5067 domain-containing protein n=1 Tax=Bifidobacterium leontopitheci TaxID=2650774 RepID=A0A6I1GNR2_9BIFI|nr:DUF5067 domain-containing protein [Bifidobacterium leontopitheci]KAB7791176.1 hypothetical protein F7D09_0342 [Bifidobacterium leontopitheci]
MSNTTITEKPQAAGRGRITICGVVGVVFGALGLVLSFIPIINNIAAILGAIGVVLAIIAIVGTFRGKKDGKIVAVVAAVLSILAIVITLAMQAAASKAIDDAMDKAVGTSQTAKSGSSKSASKDAKGEQDMEGDLKTMHVKIVSAVKSGNDYEGKPTVLVTYEWKNTTEKNNSFMVLANAQVFQNGQALETAVYMDEPEGYDGSSYMADVQPGATATATVGYVLKDQSAVTVDVTDTFSLDDSAKVAHTFNL